MFCYCKSVHLWSNTIQGASEKKSTHVLTFQTSLYYPHQGRYIYSVIKLFNLLKTLFSQLYEKEKGVLCYVDH